MTESSGGAPTSARSTESADFDVVDFLLALARRKKLIIGFPAVSALAALAVSFAIPNTYTATARILPPQQSQTTTTALIGQLSGLAGLAIGGIASQSPSDLYVGMLKSRTIADELIHKFGLREHYDVATLDDARNALEKATRISTNKVGIISVDVDFNDAIRAAEVANSYVELLDKINNRLALTEAAKRRLFFERQLRDQKEALQAAEIELKNIQLSTGMLKLDEQGRAILEAVARVRAQIAAKEVQISALRAYATEQNPERLMAEAELAGLRRQLVKLETDGSSLESRTFVPTSRVPQVGLEYVRRLRDVKYHETLFELLAKQYELARLDESSNPSLIQVLDVAIPPESRSGPKRLQIALVVGLAAAFAATLLALILEALSRVSGSESGARRLVALKAHLRIRH